MQNLRNAKQPDEQLGADEDLEVEAAPVPDDKELKQISVLAQQYLTLQSEIAALENQLQLKNDSLKTLREKDLPLAMTSVGMLGCDLVGGGRLTLKTAIVAGISEAKKPAALAALEKNNLGSLIKHELKIVFGKGEDKWAKKFMRDLAQRKKPLHVERKDSVHPQTLMANVRLMVAELKKKGLDAQNLPDDMYNLLGVCELKYAEVDTK